MKEHDYFLELMSNPTFSPKDFQLVGLDSSNTTLLDKDKYKNSQTVQNFSLFQTDGKFDEKKFDIAYEQALQQYNQLADLTEAEKPFFRNDLFAPETLKQKEPEFKIAKVANPLRQQEGFINFGIKEDPTRSVREIAESNIQYDFKTGKWLESPNIRWWDNFFNPKVLAQWDFDADENGNPTNDKDKIVYHKGEKKINPETGTYYYESLGGRNIYGRDVLSGFDTLTEDGSAWNRYDFFDSDDIEKSTWGSLSRTAAQIVPMFIPYVNTVYASTRIGISLAEIMPTIGKIFLGSDNALMSQIEGWNKAFSFSTSDATQGSQELGIEADPWTWETGFKLVADVFTQLAEQRFLFKYGNALASRVNPKLIGEGEEALKARKAYIEAEVAKSGFNLDKLKRAKSQDELAKILQGEYTIKHAQAEALLNEKLKHGQEIAKNISMAYMTGITTASSYGEAKQQGATDLEAALFALGYTYGEWKLLNSDLGQWILPELKMEKFENQAIARSLAKATENTAKKSIETESNEVQKNIFRRIFDAGKQMATAHYSDNVLKNASKMTLSSALSEGIEETSEEALLDFSKTIFNLGNSLGVFHGKFDDAWKDMSTRYTMSFLGGVVGGGIATGLPGYRAAREAQRDLINSPDAEDSNSKAYIKLVNLARNGKLQEYKDTVLKMNFAHEDLSPIYVKNSDGTISYKPANSYEESQDYAIKKYLIEQADMIDNILNSKGNKFKLTDEELLDELTRKQLKFYALTNSNVLGVYTNEYANNMVKYTDLIRKEDELLKQKNGTSDSNLDKDKREAKENKENWTETQEEELKTIQEQLKVIKNKLELYRNGTMANEFIGEALFEMTVPISSVYAPTGFQEWAEDVEGKKFEEIDPNIQKELYEQWENGSLTRREIIHRNYQVFKHNQEAFKNLFKKYEEQYFVDDKKNILRNLEELFLGKGKLEEDFSNSSTIINDIEEFVPLGTRLMIGENLIQGLKDSGIDKNLYEVFEQSLKNVQTPYEEFLGFKLPKTIEEYQNLTEEQKNSLEFLSEYPIDTDKQLTEEIKKLELEYNNNVLEEFNLALSSFMQNVEVQNRLIDILNNTKYLTPATKQYIKNFFKSANVTNPKVLEKVNEALDNVSESPVEELLNNMLYSLRDSGFNTTGMIEDVSSLLIDLANAQNVGEFSYSEETEFKIKRTKLLLDLAESHLMAARTEMEGDIGNVFGYNATINELNEKFPIKDESGKKEKKELLPMLKTSTVDSILHEIAKIRRDLTYYQKVFEATSSNKLEEHKKQEIKISQIYYNNIQKFTVDVPDDWNKSELQTALNEAVTLKDSISSNKDILSLDDRKKIFKEKLNIEKAIHKLFQNNIEKVKDVEELKKVFKSFSTFLKKESTINVGMTNEDNVDFVWYIASLVAVDPEAIYKEYSEVINDDYAPIIGQEEAIRRAYAYLIKPQIFEQFQNFVNTVVEDGIHSQNLKSLDVYNYILTNRMFLIEGDPGSGKTSATYDTLVRMLEKNHPELLEDLWFVSNSEENARNSANNLGLKATTMSKTQFFQKIASNYTQEFGPSGELIVYDKDLIEDENGIRHYKNIKLNTGVKAPKLILFDEISAFSQQDILLTDDFLKQNGIYSLAAGDFNQIGAEGDILEDSGKVLEVEGSELTISMNNSNFIGSWKLGTSMRSNNSFKSSNISKIKNAFNDLVTNISYQISQQDISFSPITLSYFEDSEKGLFGDKIETDIDKAIESVKIMLKTLSPDEEVIDENGNKKIIKTKINFITDNVGGDFYNAVMALNELEEFKDRINVVSAGASQGQEGQYYIIDLKNTHNKTLGSKNTNYASKNFIKTFYTAISRAKQGSLVFGEYEYDDKALFKSIVQNKLQINNLSQNIIKSFSSERKQIIDVDKDASTPKIDWNKQEITTEESEEMYDSGEEENEEKKSTQKINTDSPKMIENKEEGKLNILLHTFMCFETGCRVLDSSGNINITKDPMDDDAQLQLGEFNEDRIDNINGLIKISQTSQGKINLPFERRDADGKIIYGLQVNNNGIITQGKNDAITLLNTLRIAGQYIKDKNTLQKVIAHTLGVADDAIAINFAYKQHYEDYDNEEATIEEFRNGKFAKYRKYFKGKDENVVGIINESNTGEEIHQPRNQVIEMIITMPDGTQLVEIPLAKLTSPLTLLSSPDFQDIRKIYDKVGGDLKKFKLEIKKELIAKSNIPHLLEFAMLLEVYQGTAFNNIAYLDKLIPGGFTMAKFAELTGITITNNEKGEEYLKNESYYYDGKWVDIDEYKKKFPWRKISKIMVTADDYIVNGKNIIKGKPFVLVSDIYRNMSDEDLMKEYINQLKDSTRPNHIKLIYVVPPSVETSKYLINLHKALDRHKDKSKEIDENIGTKNTSFRLLSQVILNDNSEFIKLYKDFLSSNKPTEQEALNRLEQVKLLIKSLLGYENDEETKSGNGTNALYKILNTPISELKKSSDDKIKAILKLLPYEDGSGKTTVLITDKNNMTLRHLFQRELNRMLFGTVYPKNVEYALTDSGKIKDSKVQQRVDQFLTEVEWKEISLHVKSAENSEIRYSIDDSNFIRVYNVDTDYQADYQLSGKQYQINGKADSTQYVTDVVPLLKWLITGALGRNPSVLNTDMTSPYIFNEDSKAKNYKNRNNYIYNKQIASNPMESEEELQRKETERKVKKQLEDDKSDFKNLLPQKIPTGSKGMTKTKLIAEFSTLNPEERKKVLEDSREFIYQKTGFLAVLKDSKYLFSNNEKSNNAKNIKFNDDGTINFEYDNQKYVITNEGNTEKIITRNEKNPPEQGGGSSDQDVDIEGLKTVLLTIVQNQSGTEFDKIKDLINKVTPDKINNNIEKIMSNKQSWQQFSKLGLFIPDSSGTNYSPNLGMIFVASIIGPMNTKALADKGIILDLVNSINSSLKENQELIQELEQKYACNIKH